MSQSVFKIIGHYNDNDQLKLIERVFDSLDSAIECINAFDYTSVDVYENDELIRTIDKIEPDSNVVA
jgi:hypothetical protein